MAVRGNPNIPPIRPNRPVPGWPFASRDPNEEVTRVHTWRIVYSRRKYVPERKVWLWCFWWWWPTLGDYGHYATIDEANKAIDDWEWINHPPSVVRESLITSNEPVCRLCGK